MLSGSLSSAPRDLEHASRFVCIISHGKVPGCLPASTRSSRAVYERSISSCSVQCWKTPGKSVSGLEPTSRTEICRKSPSGKTGMPVPRRHRTEPCRLWLAAFIQVGTIKSYFPEQGLFGYGRHMWKANLGQASGSSSARSSLSCTRSETTEMRSETLSRTAARRMCSCTRTRWGRACEEFSGSMRSSFVRWTSTWGPGLGQS